MARLLGYLWRRSYPRVRAGLCAALAVLLLVGSPAPADAGGLARPGSVPAEEPEDDAPDPVRDARPAPVFSPGPVPDGRQVGRSTPPARPGTARPSRPAPDPAGTGRRLPLRC